MKFYGDDVLISSQMVIPFKTLNQQYFTWRFPKLIDGFFSQDNMPLCCTPTSIRLMDSDFAMAEGIYGRCEGCLKNMLQSICAFSCSPDASKFIKTYISEYDGNLGRGPFVEEMDFFASENYYNTTYESCANIVHPATGKFAMDIACGSFGSARCTPLRWFGFMGNRIENPLAPFQINYLPSDDPEGRFEGEPRTCDDPYPVGVFVFTLSIYR